MSNAAPPATSEHDPLALAGHTINLVEAATALGIGRSAAYDLAGRGEFPVPVLRVGRKLRVPVRPLRRLLDGQGPDQGGEVLR